MKYWYILGLVFVPVAFYIFVKLKSLFSENGSGTDKNEDMSEIDLKIIKKNTIEPEFKAVIGIDLGSATSGCGVIEGPFEDLGTIDFKDLIESQIIIYKPSERGLCI